MYQIPDFDRTGFIPLTHNSFVRNRTQILSQRNIEEEEKEIRIIEEERVATLMFNFA